MDAHSVQGQAQGQVQTATMKTVYTIVERGQGKNYWCKVGVGFINRDGSINLKLDAIPVNGTLQVRDYEAPGERSWERSGNANGNNRRDFGSDPLTPFGQLPPLT